MDLYDTFDFVKDTVYLFATQLRRIPGSGILVRYIKTNYQNDPVRSAVELLLFLFAVHYLLAPKYSTKNKNFVKLTEQEIDELVEEWQPEPIVPAVTEFEQQDLDKTPIIAGPTGAKVKLSNGKTVSNFASHNIFNLVGSDYLKERAVQTLRTYGVGPCGPPGFYGTQDVHMKSEADIATFLGVPACIVYAQAFQTISAVIPAFAKRGDIIVADKACNYAIQKGLEISRSTIRWYEHNDMQDLEKVLQRIQKEQAKKPLTRRFIVTEGLFENTGDMSNLPKLMELKEKYKYRLILDETWSFLVLGKTGRGLTEHQNVDATQIDMIIGSLSHFACSGGGFCAGSTEVVEHQRISGTAYVFSAALPAMLARTASETLKILQADSDVWVNLRDLIKAFRAQIDRSEFVECTSAIENPVCLISLKKEIVADKNIECQEKVLQDIVDECIANGVMITRVKPLPGGHPIAPRLKAVIGNGHSKKEVEKAGTTIRNAIAKILGKLRK